MAEKDELLKKIAEYEAKIKTLEDELEKYKSVASEVEKYKGAIEGRDKILWEYYNKEVEQIPETLRETFKPNRFESPIDAFVAIKAFRDVYNAALEAAKKEIGETEKKVTTDNPLNKKVDKGEKIDYKGDSRLEALKVLTNLMKNGGE